MFDANDQHLEELSRKAAQEFVDESLIPSWAQLERKLDIELPVKKVSKRRFAFWIICVALLSSFLYIGYESNFNKPHHTNRVTETKATTKLDALSKKVLLNLPDAAVYKNSRNRRSNQSAPIPFNKTVYSLNDHHNTHQISSKNSFKSKLKFNQTSHTDQASVNQQWNLNLSKKYALETPLKKGKIENLVSQITGIENVYLKKEKDSSGNISIVPTEIKEKLNAFRISDSLVASNEKLSVGDLNIVTPIKIKETNQHRFSVAAVAVGNINSVNFDKASRIGFDYGLLVGYKLSAKLEIKTGIILSKRYFTTTGGNISFDSAKLKLPSYNSIKMEDATGYCRFVEIPVMMYYSFPPKSKTNFYAAAGFSINKMRMENIDYTFLLDASSIVHRNHINTPHSGNGYSTSITSNFSFGLKQNLSNYWSIAFEPSLKIPLTKINTSDLKLSTFGTSASLIFNLPNKKKK